jgi:hypothetical protein
MPAARIIGVERTIDPGLHRTRICSELIQRGSPGAAANSSVPSASAICAS